jgi:hypothetical protein
MALEVPEVVKREVSEPCAASGPAKGRAEDEGLDSPGADIQVDRANHNQHRTTRARIIGSQAILTVEVEVASNEFFKL